MGHNKNRRTWVDEDSEHYIIIRTNTYYLDKECWLCETGPSQDLKGLWLLHNYELVRQQARYGN